MKCDVLVVGAGFAGSVIAERCASVLGWKVLVIERRNHIGGACYDFHDEHGVLIHRYGAHIFHTKSDRVIKYLSQFTEWRPVWHRVLSCVAGNFYRFPVNADTKWTFDGNVQKWFFDDYTRKQWGCDPKELDPLVMARAPIRKDRDDRYFRDEFQGLPIDGYATMFERMLRHPNITVRLGSCLPIPWNTIGMRRLVYTGRIDKFFGHPFGFLPYRSIRFERFHVRQPFVLPAAVVNFPGPEPYTKMVEIKHSTGQIHPGTTVVKEFPSAEGDPFYPIPKPANHALYAKYEDEAKKLNGVHFVGRLATYRYLNMDQVVAQALDEFNKIKQQRNRKFEKWSMTF